MVVLWVATTYAALKMEVVWSSETLVLIYKSKRRNNLEIAVDN
jgi:hypothetical protein